MEPSLTEKQKQLVETICALPEDQQKVVTWLIANYDTAVAICKAKALSCDERQQLLECAEQKNNLYLLSLVLLEQILNP